MEMQTKERILTQALKLFSEKGYSATSVQEIAIAVGIKAPSLYNHFQSKKQIFDGIIDMMMQRFANTIDVNNQNPTMQQQVKSYGEGGIELLKQTAHYLFNYYLTDIYASQFKKMLTIEKYSNLSMDNLYTKIFIDAPIQYQTEIFRQLVSQNYLGDYQPEIMAYHFFSPILVLLDKYSASKEKIDQAFEILDRHIEQFNEIYGR